MFENLAATLKLASFPAVKSSDAVAPEICPAEKARVKTIEKEPGRCVGCETLALGRA
jgi:hypothetical protein